MPTQTTLDHLKEGVRQFQVEVHAKKADTYRRIANTPQQPHTLIIACADSRVNVESITSSGPGEVFIARNIGNMVPAYGEGNDGVSAVIEYAVLALKIQHIAVCGHSDCGAMKALLHPESAVALPAVKSWLRNGHAALTVAGSHAPGLTDRLRHLAEENVLMQIAHLKTHPSVAGALARGEVSISGWYYDIGPGEVYIAEDGSRDFQPVTQNTAAPGR